VGAAGPARHPPAAPARRGSADPRGHLTPATRPAATPPTAGLPITQYPGDGPAIDLAWGHPAPALLPVAEWAAATEAALRGYGWQALAYGHATGPGPLLKWLSDRLARIDGRAPEPGEVFVAAGASQALDLTCAALARPGDVVLVDSPTYHLALRIIADHGVELVGAPADEDGIDPDGTAALLRRLRAAGRRVPLLYLVPTFANPTGGCLPADRRAALVAVARQAGTVVVEDDTYRELAYGPAPASLWSGAGGDGVLRLGSFAKTVAPGLRLGFLTGPPSFVRTLADRGLVDSGGGVNHTTALAMAAFGASGGYDRHLAGIRLDYRARRDALTAALRDQLPAVPFRTSAGGWFLWLRLPDWAPASRLLPHAQRHGVGFLPGARCYVTGGGSHRIRLSFSLADPAQLAQAAGRLAAALADLAADPDAPTPDDTA
jgi:2-aminoadipate transaminase